MFEEVSKKTRIDQCPFCKMRFFDHSNNGSKKINGWAQEGQPEVVCLNCWQYQQPKKKRQMMIDELLHKKKQKI